MKQYSPARPLWRRLGRLGLWIGGAIALVLAGGCAHSFRDRNPGYTLALNTPAPSAAASSAPLRVGFARLRINPTLHDPKNPIFLAGFKQDRLATQIHDDLWAVACVLDDGRTRVGFVALDAIGFFHDDVISVRRRLGTELKLDYSVVCSTHNHSTPDLLGLWGADYLQTGVNDRYRQQVIVATAQVLGEAVTNLRPARVAFHHIPTPTTNLVADTRKPIVFDPDLRVMHFTNPTNGATLGSLVTWANHPETVWSKNTEITSDFPGYLRDTLENGVTEKGVLLEPGMGGIHLYINGAVGGLMSTTPSVTVRDPYLEQDFKAPTHEKARAVGRQLAWRVLRKLEDTNAPSTDRLPLAVRAHTLELPLKNTAFLLASGIGLIDRGHVSWRKIRTEVALLTLGRDVSIACIPGEIYPEIVNGGIERAPGGDFDVEPVEVPPIREMMPGSIKFIFGLANDEIGYIIPKSEWNKKAPHLYGAKSAPYGEINSLGPDAAGLIHSAMRELCRAAKP